MVVWGKDGLDELTLGGATLVGELRDGTVSEYEIHPEDFGLAMAGSRALAVADADESRGRVIEALENRPGVAREIVGFNAAAALYVSGIAGSIGDGLERARAVLASGAARARLDAFVDATREAARWKQGNA
jgi:anthranilate phosphoribosyltransferase